ncbi:MAG: DUF3853 family protein [Bacteroidales bacterium]|jgi:hypothetical protein|nr:DUF3853 family protein [Bacteroidales bacterium]
MNITNDTRIIDLTVGELMQLLGKDYTPVTERNFVPTPEKRYVYGIKGIADLFDCSKTTANRIKKSKVIDEAIHQSGRKIVVNADLALELMRKHKEEEENF